jgi:cation diffusion facilitator family transporter
LFGEDFLETNRYKVFIAAVSVASNLLLVLLKLIVGFTIGSISVVSEALHSGVDVFAALVATVGVRRSSEPADKDHAFGHGKFENLSGLVQAFLIFFAAFWIVYEAARRLAHPAAMGELGWGVAVMFVSSIVNTAIGLVLLGAARKTGSVALKADAWHSLTDVITSAGVLFGLAAVWVGRRMFWGVDLSWIDPVAAVAVAVLIFKAAWDLTLESVRDLLDANLPQQEEDEIKTMLARNYPEVVDCHNFRGRKSGSKRFVEFHIWVDPAMTVAASHSLQHNIAAEIKRRFPDADVMVHVEPKRQA